MTARHRPPTVSWPGRGFWLGQPGRPTRHAARVAAGSALCPSQVHHGWGDDWSGGGHWVGLVRVHRRRVIDIGGSLWEDAGGGGLQGNDIGDRHGGAGVEGPQAPADDIPVVTAATADVGDAGNEGFIRVVFEADVILRHRPDVLDGDREVDIVTRRR